MYHINQFLNVKFRVRKHAHTLGQSSPLTAFKLSSFFSNLSSKPFIRPQGLPLPNHRPLPFYVVSWATARKQNHPVFALLRSVNFMGQGGSKARGVAQCQEGPPFYGWLSDIPPEDSATRLIRSAAEGTRVASATGLLWTMLSCAVAVSVSPQASAFDLLCVCAQKWNGWVTG